MIFLFQRYRHISWAIDQDNFFFIYVDIIVGVGDRRSRVKSEYLEKKGSTFVGQETRAESDENSVCFKEYPSCFIFNFNKNLLQLQIFYLIQKKKCFAYILLVIGFVQSLLMITFSRRRPQVSNAIKNSLNTILCH
jgi:hypothetical protein